METETSSSQSSRGAPKATVEQLTSQLNDGLNICRALLEDYRTKFAGQSFRQFSDDGAKSERTDRSSLDAEGRSGPKDPDELAP